MDRGLLLQLAAIAALAASSACSTNEEDAAGGAGGKGATSGATGTTSSTASSMATGSTSNGSSTGSAMVQCPTPAIADPKADERAACAFDKGATVEETLGLTAAERAAIPIKHIVVVTQENRSYDHYFGKLAEQGQPDAEKVPADFSNPDKSNVKVKPAHMNSPCVPADPPHQGTAMHAGFDNGKMDGFVKSAAVSGSNGHYVMNYYDQSDFPFYYFLANTFAISDRYFCSTLGGTWANRDYLYAGTSDGVTNTGQATIDVPTVFDELDAANVEYGVYTDGTVRQNSLTGWNNQHKGVHKFQAFLDALGDGSLPPVSFVDPSGASDEHPVGNIHGGEAWGKKIYDAAIASPLWDELAIIYTYDESGGFADHVPPPKACLAAPDQTAFGDLGIRVPMIVISPWARPHFVSHEVHEHSSTLRLIQLLHDLPALTGRDANSDALLDLFDFNCPSLLAPPAAPDAATGACN
ncbi:MAG: alkaline phosphatase family protein [Polyangiaceae bacterium]